MTGAPTAAPTGAAVDEAARLAALHRLAVLDTQPDPVFDAISTTAAATCGTPIALVTLVDAERIWFKSNFGLPGVAGEERHTGFCQQTISGERLFEVADARLDMRFADLAPVRGKPQIRFYAGAPIVLAGGERVGTVCVLDRRPRRLDVAQCRMLESLARIAAASLAAHGQRMQTTRALAASEAQYRAIVEDQTEMISVARPDGTLTFVNPAYARHFGMAAPAMLGRNLMDFVHDADRLAVHARLEALCAEPRVDSSVDRMRSAHGATRWVAWTNRPLVDAAGAVEAVQSVGRDITEQVIAERSLAESEQRLRKLYESTPAILHSIDAQGRLLDVSDRWLAAMGYERHEVVGRPSSDFLTPESADRARAVVLPEFFRSGRCDRVAYSLVRKDGGPLPVLLSAVLERTTDGAPFRSLAVLEDVTEMQRMTVELGRTHDRLDAIVDNVPAVIGHWDAEGVTRFANREFQAAVGLPLEQIVGHPLEAMFQAVDPAAFPPLKPRLAGVLEGRRQDFEFAMLTTSGLRQFHVTLVPDRARDGAVDGYYAMAHDITGRKALELRLTDSEQRYRSLFDNLDSGFALHEVIVDTEGRPVDYKFLAFNAAFGAMTGLDPATAIGRRITEVLPGTENEPADWIGVFGRVALGGTPVHMEQYSPMLDRWFSVVAFRPAAGQFAVLAQDVTLRKAAELKLKEALGEKETLLKEVYHRVKNNLQVVQSLLNLQRRSLADGPARHALEDSVERVRAMALVHEKLYQSGNLAAVSLADYTQELLKQIGEAHAAASRGVRLRAEVAPVQTGLDNAIPFGLLVTELVGNALKHGFRERDGGGWVEVRLASETGGTRLSVADDGVGLAAGFDLGAAGSMGLQLAVNLARQLGGELQVAPAGASGACFSALLTRL